MKQIDIPKEKESMTEIIKIIKAMSPYDKDRAKWLLMGFKLSTTKEENATNE